MHPDLIYQLALREVPTIGHVHAKSLIDHFGNAENIFKANAKQLLEADGINATNAKNIRQFRDFKQAEDEIKFIQKYKIKTISMNDVEYPDQLLNCYDPPILLFYRGNTDLRHTRMISIIGTRSNTEYGRSTTEKLVEILKPYNVVIVSGLAFGIDAIAHRAAIKHEIPTVGILAHGLDTLYPPEHTSLAKSMVKNGGLLTEFKSNTKPDKHNFPSRNRIAAGLSKSTVVIESGIKGGSLITADLAFGYHREVYAVPGKTTDIKSRGCNQLIKSQKATILSDPEEFPDLMGWNDQTVNRNRRLRLPFDDLTEHERILVKILEDNKALHIDELMFMSGLSSSVTASAVLTLELKCVVNQLPGKRVTLS
ncbi:MAG: DNA-processing protein DprA [Flavitalea sp.]